MTVIAWDGKTLAADKKCSIGGVSISVNKIKKSRGHLLAGSGEASAVTALFHWFENGAYPNEYPEIQKDKEDWSPLIVITPEKKIFRYEKTPYPYEIEDKFYAAGAGMDLAIGAMEMGATAKQAVEVANKWHSGCGNGIDTLEIGEGV